MKKSLILFSLVILSSLLFSCVAQGSRFAAADNGMKSTNLADEDVVRFEKPLRKRSNSGYLNLSGNFVKAYKKIAERKKLQKKQQRRVLPDTEIIIGNDRNNLTPYGYDRNIVANFSSVIRNYYPMIYPLFNGKVYVIKRKPNLFIRSRSVRKQVVGNEIIIDNSGYTYPGWHRWYYGPDTGFRKVLRKYYEQNLRTHQPAKYKTGNGSYTAGNSGYTGGKWTAAPGSTYRPYPTYK